MNPTEVSADACVEGQTGAVSDSPSPHNAHAETLLAGGSLSFHRASRGLPLGVRDRAAILYAYCRLADDAVDDAPGDTAEAVADLTARLDAIYSGNAAALGFDREFAALVRECSIPKALPAALIEGFAWDAEKRLYPDVSAVRAYGARVAGTVGAMMALVLGVRDRHVLARATDLGVAMQLTNICRDVGEDARMGRLYLPLDQLRAEGLEPEAWLQDPQPHPAVTRVVHRLLAEADGLYRQAGAGIDGLPARCRFGIFAASGLYRAIGDHLRANQIDPMQTRSVAPKSLKRRRLGGAALAALKSLVYTREAHRWPTLAETEFLVAASSEAFPCQRQPAVRPLKPWELRRRVESVLLVWEELERRERAGRR